MTTLFAAFILTAPQTPVKASDVLTKSLAKYAAASSGIGEFVMTQASGSKKVSVNSQLQFERPSKIYLHQTSESIEPKEWLLVSDGTKFAYDKPENQPGPRRRLFEAITTQPDLSGEKKSLKVHSLFLAAKRSLGDPSSPFLEFATQSAGDNLSLKGFLSRLSYSPDAKEKTAADGSPVYAITGNIFLGDAIKNPDGTPSLDSKGNPRYESAGRLEMQFTKDYDLVFMKSIETMSITDKANNLPTQVIIVTTWAGKIDLGAAPSQALFTVK